MNIPESAIAKNAKEPAILRELIVTEQAVEILFKIVESLEQKLEPILSEASPETVHEQGDRASMSPVANRIEGIGSRLARIKDQLMDITNRTEL